jgi:hypothetical protein
MLDFIDESEFVRIDHLLADRTVKIAAVQRQLVHEAREKTRLVERREFDEMSYFGFDVHVAGSSLRWIIVAVIASGNYAR